MSRIGRKPIAVPSNVEVKVATGNIVSVKGPLGQLSQQVSGRMKIEQADGTITISRPTENKDDRSQHGLTRTLINNMVVGVSEGYTKELEIVGVGYRVAKQGDDLNLTLGYSHPVVYAVKQGITFDVPTPNIIVVKGFDKQLVGQVAAEIREKRPPEPYKGKGIRYKGEYVRKKEGKTGAKKK